MDKNWISMHIFYASNANPMLVECIEPLIHQLRERDLIQRYFFIKYWMEGPHLRLRILPAEGVDPDRVKAVAEQEISDYLKRRPALYQVYQGPLDKFYRDMFIAEYGEEKWSEKYGDLGYVPLRPNNSIHYIDYEPEYERYGGVDGIELAEWHFEKSSDIVLKLIRDTNVHVRTIMLGLSVQLALPLAYCLLDQDQKMVDFFTRYMNFWQERFHENSSSLFPDFDKKHNRIAGELQRRIDAIRLYTGEGRSGHLADFEREWIAHIRELHTRMEILVNAGRLLFSMPGPNGQKVQMPITNHDAAFSILLSSYIHMTNNRLGVTTLDEVYLAYLIRRSLLQRLQLPERSYDEVLQ